MTLGKYKYPARIEKAYLLTFREEGEVKNKVMDNLCSARKHGNTLNRVGAFISLTNNSGIPLPL